MEQTWWWHGDINDNKLHIDGRFEALCGAVITYAWMGKSDPIEEYQCSKCVELQKKNKLK